MKRNIDAWLLTRVAALTLLPPLAAPACLGWWAEGHRLINRAAAERLPADMPAFLHTPAAIQEIEYLGPEPDRWRSPAEPELNSAQAPEHFIDLELADRIGPLPRRRFDFIADLYAAAAAHPNWSPEMVKDMRPEHVGLQPWEANEVYERLQAAFRDYRELAAQKQDTKGAEEAVLFYAGWLGHYVGDGSQPLHVTENYDGWTAKDNPEGYTTQHGIHALFEGTFVIANLPEFTEAVTRSPKLAGTPAVLADPFEDYLAYLRHSATLVERVYRLDKAHEFDGKGTLESRQFTAERLTAAASELRDLIYTAWIDSAKPVPERPKS